MRLTGESSPVDQMRNISTTACWCHEATGDGFSYVNLLNGSNDGWGRHFDHLHVTCCKMVGLSIYPTLR